LQRHLLIRSALVFLTLAVPTAAPAADEMPKAAKALVEYAKRYPDGKVPLPPLFKFDIPDVREVIDMPGEQRAMGIPMKLQAVVSGKRFNEVYRSVLDSFTRAGLYVAPPESLKIPLSDPVLTGLDPLRQISYTVIFKQNSDGTTTCILGEAHIGRREKTDTFFAPVPPGAQSPVQSSTEGMRTLSFTTSSQPDDVATFYREQLGKQGYREIEPLTFRNGASLWKVRAKREEGTTRVLVIDSPHLPTGELQ